MQLPPRSPFGLIQEDLWPNEWKILVACVMLNCTARKQVEKVMPTFFSRWPDAGSLLGADESEIQNVIAPLGFKTRRTNTLIKLAKAYLSEWKEVRDLPGVGEYAARAWEIFIKNDVGEACPNDHALTRYWNWRKSHDQEKHTNAS